MNLSGFYSREGSVGLGSTLFKDVRPVAETVSKSLPATPVKPVAPAFGDLTAVLKAMQDGFKNLAAAIAPPVKKAAPTPALRLVVAQVTAPVTTNTALVTAEKRARRAEIAAEEAQKAPQRATKVLSVSGNAPSLPLETEAQRRRSQQDAVAAQRSVENAAADRVLVSKGGAKVLALKALDPSLSANALVVLAYILRKWNEADRRPVRVRASDASDATGLTTVEAQAALDELEAARATIVAINSVGTRLVMPSHAAAGE
ncbi:hypothetical protein LOK46_29700 [Methylobacterium sp. NMS14P]|uniref:hypothetical protein n=1 Tax=Methylobacterium sp. NMS14P TaxID=2894310 RepID=UPI00235851F9|nr:hypothetical protein [Methylobacterium sp. NMS14P]WCS25242.1 hypothetical protein LOK46_29700 [Methylobacterium sp. NMS14P]